MKDFIYATTTISSNVANNGVIPITTIARKPCCSCIELVNNGLVFKKVGYYRISGTLSFVATAGLSSIQAYKNGLAVNGLLSSVNTADTLTYTLPIDGIIRVYCGEQPAVITLVNNGVAMTITNLSVDAEYLG